MIISALLVFLFTLTLVIWQPKGLNIGVSAMLGAFLALSLGIVELSDLGVVWGIVWNATLAFVAIILISLLLDASGFFKWAALHIALFAGGSGRRLFLYTILLGALVSAFFANDGAALILTPIVIAMLYSLNVSPKGIIAFVMSAGFIADTASLPLVISNLVNIVSADFFAIPFTTYASVMIPVDLLSIGATILMLYLFFRHDLPTHYSVIELESPHRAIKDPLTFKIGWLVLGALLIGFFFIEPLGIPISFIAMAGAIVLTLVALRGKKIEVHKTLKSAPWDIVIFSLGMYLVVYGLRSAGLTHYLTTALNTLAEGGLWLATLGTGFLIAILSSLMNNMPTVLVGALSIEDSLATGLIKEAMIYANVIGSDLGPKITPIGSLATLLWLHVLTRHKITITWRYYFSVGIILTPPILLITLIGLVTRLLLSQ